MIHFYFSLSNCSLRPLMRGKRTCSMRWLNYSGGITNDICPEIFILHHYLILISLKLLLVICRLICAQEEIQKFKTENAQVNFCWSCSCISYLLNPMLGAVNYGFLHINFRYDRVLFHLCLSRLITNFSNPNYTWENKHERTTMAKNTQMTFRALF